METTNNKFICLSCAYIYDEEKGRWEELPINWRCPDCGGTKDDFEIKPEA